MNLFGRDEDHQRHPEFTFVHVVAADPAVVASPTIGAAIDVAPIPRRPFSGPHIYPAVLATLRQGAEFPGFRTVVYDSPWTPVRPSLAPRVNREAILMFQKGSELPRGFRFNPIS